MSEVKRKVARWTGYVSAFEGGGFVAYGDYLTLEKEFNEAMNALRPFAALLSECHERMEDMRPIFGIDGTVITVGDLRRARAILEAKS